MGDFAGFGIGGGGEDEEGVMIGGLIGFIMGVMRGFVGRRREW